MHHQKDTIIIGAGLDKTGVINRMVAPIIRLAGNSSSRVIIFISLAVAGISSFMQNIGAAALFLPAIQRISKRLKIPLSQLLMPIGFSAILGGTITLVGCSPLILLNDLLVPFNLEPFGLFDVTPIGLALVASGIACFILFGRFILPRGRGSDKDADRSTEEVEPLLASGKMVELHTPADFTHYREPVLVEDLRRRYLVNTLSITEPPDYKVISPPLDTEIRSDIDLLVHVRGTAAQRGQLCEWLDGWSRALAEINHLRTGYVTDGLLDVHLVTDEDIARKTSYAAKIGAVTDAARPLDLGPSAGE